MSKQTDIKANADKTVRNAPPPIKESSSIVRSAVEFGLRTIGVIYGEEELHAGANHFQATPS